MRNIKISVRRLSVRPDAVKFYETRSRLECITNSNGEDVAAGGRFIVFAELVADKVVVGRH